MSSKKRKREVIRVSLPFDNISAGDLNQKLSTWGDLRATVKPAPEEGFSDITLIMGPDVTEELSEAALTDALPPQKILPRYLKEGIQEEIKYAMEEEIVEIVNRAILEGKIKCNCG